MLDEGTKFYARYSRAKARADEWNSLLQACFYYAVPFRNRFYQDTESQGSFNNARLYDLTAVEAVNSFVSKIHTVMTPPQVQWGYLVVDDSDPNISEENRSEAQQVVGNYMREVFKYIHRSNFDVVVGEAYFDLAIGTSCLVCNPHTDTEPLLYTSIPVDQLAIEEAIDGKVKSWFRTWKEVKISEINVRWKNAVVPPDLIRQTFDNPNATVKLVEGVTYNPGMPKEYTYSVYYGASQAPLLSQDLPVNPGIVWRFQKTNNEWWGRGPVMAALPAIMRANEMAKIEFASANLNVFRPYMGFSDNVFNPHTFKLRPLAVIPIAPIGSNGQVPLIPLPDSSNPSFGQMTLLDLRAQINNLMFADPLGPIDAPARTATELVIRQQSLAEKIGPLFTRLQQEFLWPVLQVTMYNLDKMGILPKPKLNNLELMFEYRSPLALAKGQQDLATLTQYVQVMQGIMGPDVTQLLINANKAPWVIAEWLQLDVRLLNTQPEMQATAQKMKNQQDMMMAQAQEQQQLQQGDAGI
jgi:hypothetical protein